MAQYINFEAEAEFIDGNSGKEDDEASFIAESDSFIDDWEVEVDIDLYKQYQFNIISLSCHEQLVHDMINLLYYEYWTDKQKYLYEYQFTNVEKDIDEVLAEARE